MGHRCCSKQKVKRGLWSPEEDEKLIKHITTYGHGSWSSVPKLAGLQRCGKSCRLRWINYLKPDLRKGSFTQEEEQIIIDVHRILGNRWAQIAKHLPGRTDNEVKNFWNSCIKKRLISQGLDPQTHNLISSSHQKEICSNKKYSSTSSFVVSHANKKKPISSFSVNPESEITNDIICTSEEHLLNPPRVRPARCHDVQTISSADQRNGPIVGITNTTWKVTDQNSIDKSTPNISSSSSSSVGIQHAFKSGLLDHDQFGTWDSSFQPSDAPTTMLEADQKSLLLQREREFNNYQQLHNDKIWEMQNDSNFDNYCFDHEGFMESELMSEALMSHDIGSVPYDPAWKWNFS